MSRVFEDEFMEWHASIIGLCQEVVGDKLNKLDKLYAHCLMESCETSFDAFFSVHGKVLTAGDLEIPLDLQGRFLDLGREDMDQIEKVCKKYGKPCPTEIRMVYDIKTRAMEVSYRYEDYPDDFFDAYEKDDVIDAYDYWIKEVDPTYEILGKKRSLEEILRTGSEKQVKQNNKFRFPFFWKK